MGDNGAVRKRNAWLGVAALAAGIAPGADAGHIITGGPGPTIYLAVGTTTGSPTPTIDVIRFDLTSPVVTVPGSGVAVTGAPTILVEIAYKKAAAEITRPIRLEVNSVTPLSCATPASCGTAVIPYSQFDWISSAPSQIPNGDLGGALPKTVMSYTHSGGVSSREATLTFRFLNTAAFPGGTYGSPGASGRIVFTAFAE